MARTLRVEIIGDASSLSRAFAQAQGGAMAFGKRMSAIGASAAATGTMLTTHLTVPIAALGVVAVKSFAEFEESMTKVNTLVGVNQKQIDAWSKDILDLAPKVGKSPKELADALFFVTSAGLRGKQAMDVLTMSAKASAAGLGETKVVADAVTSALNAYKGTGLTAARATDILIATVKSGKMPAEDLAASLGKVIPVASAMGIGFDEVGAAIASMTRVGLNAATASTALRGILNSFLKPSKAAAEAMKDIGTSADQVRESIATKGLMPTLVELGQKLHGNAAAWAKLTPNVRALVGELILVGKNAKDNVQIFKDVANSAGLTDRAFERTTKESAFKFQQMLAALKVALISLGEILEPVAVQLAGWVTRLAKAFRDLSPETKELIAKIAGIAAVAGPALLIFGKITQAVGILGRALIILATNPFVLLLAALATFAGAMAAAVLAPDKLKGALERLGVSADTAGKIVDGLQSTFKSIAGAVRDSWPAIAATARAVFAEVQSVVANAATIIRNHWDQIKSAGVAAFGALKTIISGFVSMLSTNWGQSLAIAAIAFYGMVKAALAAKAAIIALRSIGLAGSPLLAGLALVSIAVGALVQHFLFAPAAFNALSSAADSMGTALNRSRSAIDGIVSAYQNMTDTLLGVRSAQLGIKAAELAAQGAHLAYNQAVKQSGKNSLEAKTAYNAWQQSIVQIGFAHQQARSAADVHSQAVIKHIEATQKAVRAEWQSASAYGEVAAAGRSGALVIADLTAKYGPHLDAMLKAGKLSGEEAQAYEKAAAAVRDAKVPLGDYIAAQRLAASKSLESAEALRKIGDGRGQKAAMDTRAVAQAAAEAATNLGRVPTAGEVAAQMLKDRLPAAARSSIAGFAQALGQLPGVGKGKVEQLGQMIASLYGSLRSRGEGAGSAIREAIVGSLASLGVKLTPKVLEGINAAIRAFDQGGAKIPPIGRKHGQNTANEFGSGLGALTQKATGAVAQAAAATARGFAAMTGPARTKGAETSTAFGSGLQSIVGKASSAVAGAAQAVSLGLGNAPKTAKSKGAESATGFGSGIAGIVAKTVSSVAGAAGAVGKGLTPVAAQAKTKGKTAATAFGQGLSGMPGIATAVVNAASASFRGAASGMAGMAFSVGANVSSSMASGIRSQIPAIQAAASAAASAAETATRAKTQVHSESPLFRKIGEDVGKSLASGLVAISAAVAGAAAKMAGNVVETIYKNILAGGAKPQAALKQAMQLATQVHPAIVEASKTLGRKTAEAVALGVLEKSPSIADQMKRALQEAVAKAKGDAKTKAEIEQYGAQLGIAHAQGIARGVIGATPPAWYQVKVALQAEVQKMIAAAAQKVTEARGALSEAFGGLADGMLAAFDAKVAAWKSPAQKILDKLQLQDLIKQIGDALGEGVAQDLQQIEDLLASGEVKLAGQMADALVASLNAQLPGIQAAIDTATASLATAQAELAAAQATGDQPAIDAAQKKVDAAEAEKKAQEEKKAAVLTALAELARIENIAHEKKAEQDRLNMEADLVRLRKHLGDIHRTWDQKMKEINALLKKYGIKGGPYELAGEGIPLAVAAGINSKISEVRKAVGKIQDAVSELKTLKAKLTVEVEIEGGLPHAQWGAIVTKPTVLLAGETGPEAIFPLTGAPGRRAMGALASAGVGSESSATEVHLHLHGGTFIGTNLQRAARELAPELAEVFQRSGRTLGGNGF